MFQYSILKNAETSHIPASISENPVPLFFAHKKFKKKSPKKLLTYGSLDFFFSAATVLTLLGLGLIKINTVSANFNNPRPLLILNN